MWDLDHKESRTPKNWCFQTVFLKKTLESPLDHKVIKAVNLKGNQPWIQYSLEALMLKLQYFGDLLWRADSMEKTPMLGKIEGRRRRGWQRMKRLDGITDSIDMNLGKLQEMVMDRETRHVAVHRVASSWTWFGEWTTNSRGMSIQMAKKDVELTYPTITSDIHLNVEQSSLKTGSKTHI